MTTTRFVILVVTYLLIAVQRVPYLRLNRPSAALLGAVAMVTIGGLPLNDAYAAIDLDVMVFLLGVLLITGFLEIGGFFEWAARHVVRRARSARALLAAVVAVFAGALIGWLLGFSLPLVAITAAAILLAIAQRDPVKAFEKVEWSLLLFFGALFVVMRGARDLPLIASLTSAAGAQLHGAPMGFGDYFRVGLPVTVLTLAWGIAALVVVAR